MGGVVRRGSLALLALVVVAVACSAPEQQETPEARLGTTASALTSTTRYEAESCYWSGVENQDGELVVGPPASRYFWTNGYVSQDHDFVGGATTITVRARGELVGGVGPHVVVHVGGVEIGSTYVNETSYVSKTFAFNATPGVQEIRATFDNDDFDDFEDRNLLLDWIEVEEPRPSCADVTYEAEEMPWSGVEGVDGEISTYEPGRYLWSNGYIYTHHAFLPGPMKIRVRARGDLALGVGPHFVVSIDGVVIGDASIGTSYVESTATEARRRSASRSTTTSTWTTRPATTAISSSIRWRSSAAPRTEA